MKNVHFTTVLTVRHARSDERVAGPRNKFGLYHRWGASDTHEVTKRSLVPVKNLHFTTVLHVQHARSEERVACSGQGFCILPQFCTSNTHEVRNGSLVPVKDLHFTTVLSIQHARSDERAVKSTGAFPAPRTEKEYILRVFERVSFAVFIPQSFLQSLKAVFSLVFEDLQSFL